MNLSLQGSREARLPASTVDELSGTAVVDLPGARWVTPVLMRVLEKLFERGMNPKLLFDAYWRHVSKRP